jgi:hypothetical protein
MRFVESDIFHIQRQGIYGSKCQRESFVQFWKNYSWWILQNAIEKWFGAWSEESWGVM